MTFAGSVLLLPLCGASTLYGHKDASIVGVTAQASCCLVTCIPCHISLSGSFRRFQLLNSFSTLFQLPYLPCSADLSSLRRQVNSEGSTHVKRHKLLRKARVSTAVWRVEDCRAVMYEVYWYISGYQYRLRLHAD